MPRVRRAAVGLDHTDRAFKERIVMVKCWGLLARLRGEPAGANPFPPGSVYAQRWGTGWGSPDPHCRPRGDRRQKESA